MAQFKRKSTAKAKEAEQQLVTRVLRVRLKDKHAALLRAQAAQVNLVWNFCNETGLKVLRREGKFVNASDLHLLTVGATKAGLDLHSQTVQAVNEEYVTRRQQFQKAKLNWRVSNPDSARYSLGWVPFKKSALAYRNGQVHFRGVALSVWDSYGLAGYQLGAGCFSEDARGRWYLNVTVKVKKKPLAQTPTRAIGIDLGLKDFMAGSNGLKVKAERFYRGIEPKLAVAQRAGKKGRVKALHAKAANRRKDALHKLSTTLVRTHQLIAVGDVSPSALAQTKMAKSIYDAGWSAFRTMLSYKCDDAGSWFFNVNEAYSTQECHRCGETTGPKGLQGLSQRSWTCSACGAEHERDLNSALVIRSRGLTELEKQFTDAAAALEKEVSNKAPHHHLA